MSTSSVLRALPRAIGRTAGFRAARPSPVLRVSYAPAFSTARVLKADNADGHGHEESFEEFTARYEKEFDTVQDVFELQRNLNNAFAYDLVPSPSVLVAALKAARRVNDYPTAVRVFEGIKAKVENKNQYEQYLEELRPIREELGVELKEDLFPEESK
ncbi:hypothetical protein VF21_04713 [Pseudogymnoascus sp. 05NY08]|nr:hypothetical protein VE00_02701 [Pseudogymnoascus sp. WSF 3629]OBT76861.1 hypothetical protein VF21_04713 [Pseudogymnoascus sp. 05NY08]OBT88568.1 hypothetical protein VE02_03976 [Pseudogymnoascus sp. 03VT05]